MRTLSNVIIVIVIILCSRVTDGGVGIISMMRVDMADLLDQVTNGASG